MNQICQEAKSICTEKQLQTKVKKQATFRHIFLPWNLTFKNDQVLRALGERHGGRGGIRQVRKETILQVIFVC